MAGKDSLNDIVLLAALAYSAMDLAVQWTQFGSCHWPINKWLMVSYATVIALRVSGFVGTLHAEADEGKNFLLNLRQQGTGLRTLVSLTWCAALPFFALWTMLGTVALRDVLTETPECFPPGTSAWFIIFWQFLSYAWVGVHGALGLVAWVLERRVRNAEERLHELEDSEVLARWGTVSNLSGYRALPWKEQEAPGLSPAEIRSLPSSIAGVEDVEDGAECSICLCGVLPGEQVRTLGGCGHRYHSSCLDLWLLRCSDCPLCKREVKAVGTCSPCVATALPIVR